MNLTPSFAGESKQPAGTEFQFQRQIVALEHAVLPAKGVKYLAGALNGVVVKLDVDLRRSLEEALIEFTNVGPPAANTTQWVRHGGLIRRDPVAFHQRQIPTVESLVEFAERAQWFPRIDRILASGHYHQTSAAD